MIDATGTKAGWTVYQGGPFPGFTVWGLRSPARNLRVAAKIEQGTYVFSHARLLESGLHSYVFAWKGGRQ